tara:strand:+ start:3820 stop:4827 length:1008 start_codon:yes stop_codon:yes gene_type:complete
MYEINKNLIGHEDNLSILTNQISSQKLSNSLILYGNKGIGKNTFVYFFINKYLNILFKNKNLNTSNLIYNNSHPNIRIINKEYDEKTKKMKQNITIEQIRSISNFVYKSSINNLPKFVIIDSADDLNKHSSNALLKVLEEPTNNTFIFLIAHQISILLPTIRSRCIKIRFNNPSIDEFKKILLNINSTLSNEEIEFLFDISNGSPGLAIEYYSKNINNTFESLLNIFKEKKPLSSNILELSNNVGSFDNDEFKIFISLIKFILINTIKINLGVNINNFFKSNLTNSLLKLSKNINNIAAREILDYLSLNENDLYRLNLDKKLFSLNIFSPLTHSK